MEFYKMFRQPTGKQEKAKERLQRKSGSGWRHLHLLDQSFLELTRSFSKGSSLSAIWGPIWGVDKERIPPGIHRAFPGNYSGLENACTGAHGRLTFSKPASRLTCQHTLRDSLPSLGSQLAFSKVEPPSLERMVYLHSNYKSQKPHFVCNVCSWGWKMEIRWV